MSDDTSAQLLKKFFNDKNIAKNYAIAERATGPPAQALIQQAGLLSEFTGRFEVLDNACGTGVVTAALHKAFRGEGSKLKIVCGDLSEKMVESIKERITQMDGLDAEATVLNGQSMDIPANQFTHVLTNFGFQSFPDPLLGLRESVRVAKPGGVIGMTNWIAPGWDPAFRLALSRIPGAPSFAPGPLPYMTRSGRWFEETWTREQLEALPEVDAKTINIQRHSFTVDLNSEEEIKAFVGPLQVLLDVFMAHWSETERIACGEGKLMDAMMQAMKEEPVLVWKSLVTTVHKKSQ